ncbi:potassium-transporting ATPase subunit KdpC [Peribacillus sp. NPDC097295]|uniref:potassium-transporting ATPase subunit KdpC n=1 Tax=Peribacillus sp. NPDC097295 TaxID=3364402 RepID=UPI003824AA8F
MLKNIRIVLVLLFICGMAYPLLITGLSQVLMPAQAEGSLIKNEKGQFIGSELIGQSFEGAGYFHGRISSINYDAAGSGSLNYSPSNEEMIKRTEEEMATFLKENPTIKKEEIPSDLMTNSGSGLDPNISPKGALVQVPRIARERGIPEKTVYNLVEEQTENRSNGIFGESHINVLKLNITLDELK